MTTYSIVKNAFRGYDVSRNYVHVGHARDRREAERYIRKLMRADERTERPKRDLARVRQVLQHKQSYII